MVKLNVCYNFKYMYCLPCLIKNGIRLKNLRSQKFLVNSKMIPHLLDIDSHAQKFLVISRMLPHLLDIDSHAQKFLVISGCTLTKV